MASSAEAVALGLPADYGRTIGGITAAYCRPSQSEFDMLDKVPAYWKSAAEWRALANKYEDARLLALRDRLKAKASEVEIYIKNLKKMVDYPSKMFTQAQWRAMSDKLMDVNEAVDAEVLYAKSNQTVAAGVIIKEISPPDPNEVEYFYLMSFPDGQKTKAELQAAAVKFKALGYNKFSGALSSKAMYFDIDKSAPKPAWWTDIKANPDYKGSMPTKGPFGRTIPSTAFAPEIFAPPPAPKYAEEKAPFLPEKPPPSTKLLIEEPWIESKKQSIVDPVAKLNDILVLIKTSNRKWWHVLFGL